MGTYKTQKIRSQSNTSLLSEVSPEKKPLSKRIISLTKKKSKSLYANFHYEPPQFAQRSRMNNRNANIFERQSKTNMLIPQIKDKHQRTIHPIIQDSQFFRFRRKSCGCQNCGVESQKQRRMKDYQTCVKQLQKRFTLQKIVRKQSFLLEKMSLQLQRQEREQIERNMKDITGGKSSQYKNSPSIEASNSDEELSQKMPSRKFTQEQRKLSVCQQLQIPELSKDQKRCYSHYFSKRSMLSNLVQTSKSKSIQPNNQLFKMKRCCKVLRSTDFVIPIDNILAKQQNFQAEQQTKVFRKNLCNGIVSYQLINYSRLIPQKTQKSINRSQKKISMFNKKETIIISQSLSKIFSTEQINQKMARTTHIYKNNQISINVSKKNIRLKR